MKPGAAYALIGLLAVAIPGSGLAQGQGEEAAVTLTPKSSVSRPRLLVNKVLGRDRWAISVNLAQDLEAGVVPRVLSVTGNVLTDDTQAVSFVYCQVRRDSVGSLADENSVFRLMCKGTGACKGSALVCAREGWQTISRDVEVPASFFLPPGGLRASGETQQSGWIVRVLARAAAWIGDRAGVSASNHAHAQEEPVGGASLSPDRLNHLVLRDFGNQRWAISFNLEPNSSDSRGLREADVTGNVYNADGPPAFVQCEQNAGLPTQLADPSANLTLRCRVAGPCLTSAEECASSGWETLPETTMIPVSFFLPEGDAGSIATTSSEEPLLVLGGSSSTTSIGANQIRNDDGTCNEGDVCEVDRIGSCENIRGRKTSINGACRCLVTPVPPYCTRTGTEGPRDGGFIGARIKAACGAPCAFEVGVPADDKAEVKAPLARGVSLPHEIDATNCFCQVSPAGKSRGIETCNTSAKAGCEDSACCVDDPRDACNPLDGDLDCAGICIAASGSETDACAGRTLATQICGDGIVEGSEICDPADDAPPSCRDLGFTGGELTCAQCRPDGCEGPNEAPKIIRFDEAPPGGLDKYGRQAFRGAYEDRDGDVKEVRLTKSDGSRLYANINAAGRTTGEFVAVVGCNGSDEVLAYDVHVIDAEGNVSSNGNRIDSTCVEREECGDGLEQEGEACDFASDAVDEACPAGEVCRNDCTCGAAGSCAGRCCSSNVAFCAHPGLQCHCDPGCDEAGRRDCCADYRRECGS